MYSITSESSHHPDIINLIAALDRYQANSIRRRATICLIYRSCRREPDPDGHSRPAADGRGCGAVVLNGDGTGEMKRVYIDPTHRGQHLGETLLAALEDEALSRDCHTVRLETGIKQHAAVRLYERCGYEMRPPFAPYTADPLSLFMEKALVVDVRSAAL
jgi:putative acetyltransferase